MPRGVAATPTRFESAAAIVRSWSMSSMFRLSIHAPSFAVTPSCGSDWRMPAACLTISATLTGGPAAYFDLQPWRYGSPGAWTYYLVVKLTGCAHANQARVAVSGGRYGQPSAERIDVFSEAVSG